MMLKCIKKKNKIENKIAYTIKANNIKEKNYQNEKIKTKLDIILLKLLQKFYIKVEYKKFIE